MELEIICFLLKRDGTIIVEWVRYWDTPNLLEKNKHFKGLKAQKKCHLSFL
jgi:hypothetical protein